MERRIIICMGSSCFSRGNRENTEIIENFLLQSGVESRVEFSGSRCEDRCERGPVIQIGGKTHERVDRALLLELLEQLT